MRQDLPVPAHFDLSRIASVWEPDFASLTPSARQWAKQQGVVPAALDRSDPRRKSIALMCIDMQNTFCLPEFELYVGGRSGTGAIDDTRRVCEFIYRNCDLITQIALTLDTHVPIMIFHELFWVNDQGENPTPGTQITLSDIKTGKWKPNPAIAGALRTDYPTLVAHAMHYAETLERKGRYSLSIWAYHGMLGSVGHALASPLCEAVFWHSVARVSQPDFQVKGHCPWTENYSIFAPEVETGPNGDTIASKNTAFLEMLMAFDIVAICGQAKSHCVAWTIEDLLDYILKRDPSLASKVYLLEDCTSSVVIPPIGFDFTEQGDQAFEKFRDAGMHVVKSTDSISTWADSGIA